MAKRVHFTQANASYSPGSCTPSPSHSVSSLPSESDPPTPPVNYTPMFHPRTPFESKPNPLPNFPYNEIYINKLLAFAPLGIPAVYYDLRDPPHLLLQDSQVSFTTLDQSATEPPLHELTIEYPLFSPTLVRSGRHGYVSTYDVLQAIHYGLWQLATGSEYAALDSAARRRVDGAFFARCKGSFDDNGDRRLGIRRVDLLAGATQFLGLSRAEDGPPDIWQLKASRPQD